MKAENQDLASRQRKLEIAKKQSMMVAGAFFALTVTTLFAVIHTL